MKVPLTRADRGRAGSDWNFMSMTYFISPSPPQIRPRPLGRRESQSFPGCLRDTPGISGRLLSPRQRRVLSLSAEDASPRAADARQTAGARLPRSEGHTHLLCQSGSVRKLLSSTDCLKRLTSEVCFYPLPPQMSETT